MVTGVAGVVVGPGRGVLKALVFPFTTTPAATAEWWGVCVKEMFAVLGGLSWRVGGVGYELKLKLLSITLPAIVGDEDTPGGKPNAPTVSDALPGRGTVGG